MKKQLRFISLLLIFSGLALSGLTAQTFGSEAELKEQAAKLFDDDQFEEAYPLYAQLASLYNKDPNINYRLGVCMLYASEDKEKPIPFLELAAKYPDVEKEVFFYLAKAYHLNYRFDDAIKQYQAYQKIASGPKAEKLQVARQIEMCKNGKKLLRNLSDLIVIDKKEMSRTDFYRAYDISAIGGKLLAKPDEDTFKTSIDKKKKETSIIYFSSDNNQIYFASYGDDASHGKDIYLVRKLPNGELSKPQTLGYPINTEYDEDFPFLHPNGKVLYFCSKGHNSMGGYDIFKSTLNELTNTWNKPVNLDFPINSPDDDILYITNADEKEAYFSSARSSATGKTAVYHINVERKPIDVAIVSGTFVKTNSDQDLNVKITVKDLETNTILGIYNSKPESGDFSMNLPSGGKVMYTVESPGFPTQSEVVDIPAQTSLTPIKQEISYEPGTGKLTVTNHVEESAGDENYLTAINLIKEKSKMEVNVNEMTADNANKQNNKGSEEVNPADESSATKTGTKPPNLSNEEIVKIAYTDASDTEKEAKELKDQAAIALVIANQRNEQAQNKAREAAQLTSDASRMTDNVKKQTAMEQANTANKDVAALNQLTVNSYNVAKTLQMKADAKRKEADLSLQYAKDLEAAVKSKSSKEALAKLDEQQKKLEAISQENDESDNISVSLNLDAENKKRELDKAIQTSTDIKQEIADNETAIGNTEEDLAKEKNENVKQGLRDQIQGLKDDIVTGKKDLETNEIKVAQLQKEYNGVNNQIEIFNSVVAKAKTGNNDGMNATADAIDKSKLEQEVNTLKNSDNTLASIKPVSSEKSEETPGSQSENKTDVVKDHSVATKTESGNNNVSAEKQNIDTASGQNIEQNENVKNKETPAIEASLLKNIVITPSDKIFVDELTTADAIPDEVKKETKKAEVFEKWSSAIQKELDDKKLELQAEQNEDKKTELSDDVNVLQNKLENTQQLRAVAIEKLKQDQRLAVNKGQEDIKTTDRDLATAKTTAKTTGETTVNPADKNKQSDTDVSSGEVTGTEPATDGVNVTPETKQQIETFEQVYAQEIADAERAPTEKEQEEKKLKAANNYVNSITLVVNSKKSDLKEQPDQEKQKELNQDIAVMEKNIAAKQKLADDSKGKIAVITKTPVNKDQLPGDVATKQTAKDKVGNQLKEETATPVKNIVDTKQPFTYSTISAKSNLVKAAALNKEAADLFAESKRVKEQAALQNDVTEKNALYAKAEELSKSAETKKVEAAQAVGTANATEYRNNQHAIDQYINANTGSADELAIADLMKDEAKMYFDKAQNSRKAAASFETYYAKETALEDADKNEQIALQKQNSALAIYKKNNPKFVVKPLAVTDIAAKTVAKDKETSKPPAGDDKTLALNKTAVKPEASTNKEKTTAADKPVVTDKQDVTAEKTTTNNLNATDKSLTSETPVKPETTETPVKPVTTETAKPVITEPSTTDKSVPSNIKEVSKQKDTEDKTDTAVPVTPDQSVKNNVVKTDQSLADNETKKTINLPVKENEKENTKETGTKITDRPSGTANDLERPITVVKPAENTKAKTKFSFKELFEKRGRSRYSDANPIPMDEKLPDGLVFKVQMGAFKNPIPQDLFKGITPVTGQTTSQGFIRYSAGLFLTCESAEKAKVEIRELGFPDAFVVAYFDGKRIPSPCGADGTTITEATKPTEEVIVQKTETISPPVITSPVVKTKPETGIAATEIAPTTDVATLKGLFYTVQVGVYSRPVTAGELYNVQPLYTETVNNLLRYNVGIYNNIPLASEAKQIAVNAGLKDAFVTIYYNGKRISMAQAATLTAQGITAITSAPLLNQLPTFKKGASIQNTPIKNTPTVPLKNNTTQPPAITNESNKQVTETPVVKPTVRPAQQTKQEAEAGLVYKIQIGAFNEEVPLETANKFLKISKKGIKNYKDEKGLTIYTVGKYATYEEADKARQEVVAEGLPDAFVVAFSDGKKISLEEAQKLTGKN